MSMPDLVVYEGIAIDFTIELSIGTFDFTDWDDIKIVSTALSLSKTSGGSEIDNVAASSMDLHILAADSTGKDHRPYRYQMLVETGGVWYAVPGAEGTITVRAAA